MVETIFGEMVELFPSAYFHVGADEVPALELDEQRLVGTDLLLFGLGIQETAPGGIAHLVRVLFVLACLPQVKMAGQRTRHADEGDRRERDHRRADDGEVADPVRQRTPWKEGRAGGGGSGQGFHVRSSVNLFLSGFATGAPTVPDSFAFGRMSNGSCTISTVMRGMPASCRAKTFISPSTLR